MQSKTPSRDTATPPPTPWHARGGDDVLRQLGGDRASGLAVAEAERRLGEVGRNEIEEGERRTAWRMLAEQLSDFMIIVLLAAALVAGLVGETHDAVAILVIVLLNAIIGAVQEHRAERAVAALRRMAAPEAGVVRGGEHVVIAASEVVPGDLLHLEAGCVVAADMRLLECADLRVDESPLTGESEPVLKDAAAVAPPDAPVGDRLGMAYRGTHVTSGRGAGIVVATGMATELGRIAALLRREPPVRTPLQRRLAQLGRKLALIVLAVCAVVFVAGVVRGEPPLLMFLTAVSLGVAAIPEALPAVVTVSLALGARKMIRRHALVRRLPAVETLGSVTTICSDKTGTLTRNTMRVEKLLCGADRRDRLPAPAPDGSAWALLARALTLSNDASEREGGERPAGDPTEAALLEAGLAAGPSKREVERASPRIAEVAFDSERRLMTTLHREGGGTRAFVKGAPEAVLPRCVEAVGEDAPLDAAAAIEDAERLAAEGYRVLAFATRSWPGEAPTSPEDLEAGLGFLGLVGLVDPPREEAAESVALCIGAGITPVMITGDHPGTALAIARRLGIAGAGDVALTGRELARLEEPVRAERIRATRVFARVSPEQKIEIVRSLQQSGELVAMTGDGVNDAPALERAEIGVAMGRQGTEVAREAADMVLLDDNFATIVGAVREGRRVFDNIRKFVKYTMTSNTGEIATLLFAPFLGLPLPLLPIQILWINLVTDGLPGLALAAEPEERGSMSRPPRPPRESIFAQGTWQHMIWVGLLIAGLTVGAQAWAYRAGSDHWQTIAFTVLVLSQLAHSLVVRSERDSIFVQGLRTNMPLLGAVVLTVALQLAVVYVPILQATFKTARLTALEISVCFALPLVVVAAVEIEKLLVRRGVLRRT